MLRSKRGTHFGADRDRGYGLNQVRNKALNLQVPIKTELWGFGVRVGSGCR